MDRRGLYIKYAPDRNLLPREFFRCLLVAQRVAVLTVVQNVHGVVSLDAGDRALCVRRAHAHLGMIGLGAHAVRNDTGKLLLDRRRQDCKCEKTQDQGFTRLES